MHFMGLVVWEAGKSGLTVGKHDVCVISCAAQRTSLPLMLWHLQQLISTNIGVETVLPPLLRTVRKHYVHPGPLKLAEAGEMVDVTQNEAQHQRSR
jgi:hypothetical protein